MTASPEVALLDLTTKTRDACDRLDLHVTVTESGFNVTALRGPRRAELDADGDLFRVAYFGFPVNVQPLTISRHGRVDEIVKGILAPFAPPADK